MHVAPSRGVGAVLEQSLSLPPFYLPLTEANEVLPRLRLGIAEVAQEDSCWYKLHLPLSVFLAATATMDPTQDRMNHAEQVSVSKKMFYAGFLGALRDLEIFLSTVHPPGLPWLWVVNYLLFRPHLARQSCPDELRW